MSTASGSMPIDQMCRVRHRLITWPDTEFVRYKSIGHILYNLTYFAVLLSFVDLTLVSCMVAEKQSFIIGSKNTISVILNKIRIGPTNI